MGISECLAIGYASAFLPNVTYESCYLNIESCTFLPISLCEFPLYSSFYLEIMRLSHGRARLCIRLTFQSDPGLLVGIL